MKIGNPSGPAPTAATAEQTAATAAAARPAGEQRATAATAGDASAKVELSSTATTMLSGSNAASADFDAEKVARISQSIADGSFRIDAGAIADRLIANAEEVLRNGAMPGG